VGSFAVKIFEHAVAGTGLSVQNARAEGLDVVNVHISQLDRAHFYPEKGLMYLDLVVERDTGRVLGMQGFSPMGDALVGRVNAVASMLPHRPTAEDLSTMELAYSPPFSAAMDIVNALGNVAENVLAGRLRGVDPDEFRALWEKREDGDVLFVDCRSPADGAELAERMDPAWWRNIPQEDLAERLQELPRDRRVVLVCNTGARSYEAQVQLEAAGVRQTENVLGGIASLKKRGMQF
jgi:rhodanese-related sulfurtransferase